MSEVLPVYFALFLQSVNTNICLKIITLSVFSKLKLKKERSQPRVTLVTNMYDLFCVLYF